MSSKCQEKIISNLEFSTHPNDHTSVKIEKEIFICVSSHQIYLPWALFQEGTRGCVPPEKERMRPWMEKTWNIGINIEGGLREFPGWCYREVLVGRCSSGLAGGWRETIRVSPGTKWVW